MHIRNIFEARLVQWVLESAHMQVLQGEDNFCLSIWNISISSHAIWSHALRRFKG